MTEIIKVKVIARIVELRLIIPCVYLYLKQKTMEDFKINLNNFKDQILHHDVVF